MKLLGFAGSLRKGSYNRALLNAFSARLPQGVELLVGEIGDLPLFNEDLEGPSTYPPQAQRLKDAIRAADGIVIAVPEFNRGMPGALKNMLDWTSRPEGNNAWPGKKVFVFGASNGDRGAIVAQYDLKRTLTYFGCRVLGQPEFYLNATGKFDEAGKLTDEKTAGYVDRAVAAFVDFIKQ